MYVEMTYKHWYSHKIYCLYGLSCVPCVHIQPWRSGEANHEPQDVMQRGLRSLIYILSLKWQKFLCLKLAHLSYAKWNIRSFELIYMTYTYICTTYLITVVIWLYSHFLFFRVYYIWIRYNRPNNILISLIVVVCTNHFVSHIKTPQVFKD